MAEMHGTGNASRMKIRYRGRGAQVWIYLGKLLRMFVYQNDWKVLPMSALIAGLVGMVVRKRLFLSMEGTLIGSFAMVCVCIWNGCFNSIQVICRERDVVKREHRSGMHISSYIAAHMIYQALICLMQTGVTMYVTKLVGIRYDLGQPLFTSWFLVDFGISMFLITYASDMMSLWVSTIAHTTTTAMTIMPFILIFELVFSGGMMSLPSWTRYFTPFTVSNPGLRLLAAQGDYNNRPLQTIWNQVIKMENKEVSATVKLSQLVDVMSDENNETVAQIRKIDVSKLFTLGDILDMFENSDYYKQVKDKLLLRDVTLGSLLTTVQTNDEFSDLRSQDISLLGISVGNAVDMILEADELKPVLSNPITIEMTVGELWNLLNKEAFIGQYRGMTLNMTFGQVIDQIAASSTLQPHLDDSYTVTGTVGQIIKTIGEDRVRELLEKKIAEASYDKAYEYSDDNVSDQWATLILFVFAFAALATITLEFIDKDKR